MKFNAQPEDDAPASGNIFGWKVSLIGLVLIVVLGALATYRHYSLDVPVGFDDPLEMPNQRDYYHDKADREAAAEDSLRKSRRQ